MLSDKELRQELGIADDLYDRVKKVYATDEATKSQWIVETEYVAYVSGQLSNEKSIERIARGDLSLAKKLLAFIEDVAGKLNTKKGGTAKYRAYNLFE